MKEANTKHGLYSAEMLQARCQTYELIRESKAVTTPSPKGEGF